MSSLDAIEEKLDVIINNQAVMNVKQDEMSRRLGDVEGAVSALDKTVRGSNGTPGLVSSVSVNTTRVDRLVKDVDELAKRRDHDMAAGKTEKKDDDDTVTWKWLVNELVLPIGLGFLAFVLFQVLPQILGHMGSGAQ